MSTAIKKTSKKIWYSLLFFGASGIALLLGFFVGGNHSNLSRLDSKAKEIFNDLDSTIPAAHADTPSACIEGGSSGGGCGSDGGSGEGGGP